MSDERGGAPAFNIGSQQAGAIYQSAGDQVIHHGDGTLSLSVSGAVADLRSAVSSSGTALAPHEREHAGQSLDAVEAELRQAQPDKQRIARALEGFAKVTKKAGSLASSRAALELLAAWLGPPGVALLKMIT